MTESELYEMSDEELEAAFKAAKAEEAQGNVEEEVQEEPVVEETEEELVDDQEDLEEDTEVIDEDIDDGAEQPDEDSDHDAEVEDDDIDDSDEETDETDEDTPDGETEEDEADTTEDEEVSEDETQEEQKLSFKANGQEYEFSRDEMMEQFPRIFGQAMDYTKKMQAIKPYRKTIDAIEQAKLSHDDINLMIDVLKGDKDAMSEVIKRTGIDTLDLDTENSNYVAKDYGRDETTLAINDVIDTISRDVEFAETKTILEKRWDDTSFNEMTKDPQMIALLHEDVRSGMYAKVQPIADKLKVYDGGKQSDIEYYKLGAQQYFAEQSKLEEAQRQAEKAKQEAEASRLEKARLAEVKAKQEKRKVAKQASKKRKAAAPTRSNAGNRGVTDYLDDSDEAFEAFYEKTMGMKLPKNN